MVAATTKVLCRFHADHSLSEIEVVGFLTRTRGYLIISNHRNRSETPAGVLIIRLVLDCTGRLFALVA